MNLQTLFSGIAIGRDNSGNFRPSLKGLAVRTEKSRFVSIENDQLLDVTPFTFDNVDDVVFRMPIRNPRKGDLIVISDAPLRTLFVQEVHANGHLRGLDPINSAVIDYAPTGNLLKLKFYVKVMSLLDAMGGKTDHDKLLFLSLIGKSDGRTGADENLLLSLLLKKSDGAQDFDKDMMLLLLMRGAGSGAGGAAEILLLQHLLKDLERSDRPSEDAAGTGAGDPSDRPSAGDTGEAESQ
jgi:hypothetical protein